MLAILLMVAQNIQPVPLLEPSMTIVSREPVVIPDADVSREPEVIRDADFDLSPGSCDGIEGPVDMKNLWLLQDREVKIKTPVGPLIVTVDRDKLKIAEKDAGGRESVRVWEISRIFQDENERLDVQLSLGILERGLVVHWRETFQNRIYRQGVLRIDGRDVVLLCEGRGGFEVSH